MNSGNAIFAQLVGFLSHYKFQKCVSRYDGDHKVKPFSDMILVIMSCRNWNIDPRLFLPEADCRQPCPSAVMNSLPESAEER
jgi:hypothetical protein